MGPPPLSTAGDAAAGSSSTAGFMPASPAQATSIAGIGLSAEAAAAAAAAAASAAAGPAGPTAPPPIPVEPRKGGNRCQHSTRMQILEAKLQVLMDHEDARVKELTEGVLYELLPSALNVMLPNCEDPLTELDPERCRAVAGAALAASALMNAPPGFLEFLLCIPWRRLPQLHPSTAAAGGKTPSTGQRQQQPEQELQPQPQPSQQAGQQQDLLAESAADEEERRLLVNLPLHPQLVRPVLQFMYKPQHEDSVPPVLRPEKEQHVAKQQPQQAGQQQQPPQQQQQPGRGGGADCTADENLLAVAEALLDGATPLHCAALRGNPAQVDHLLYCGADPTRKTAVGDLPLQLVPRCGGYSQATRMCTCLGPSEQAVWECRSRVARTLIANKCITAFRVGLLQYLSLLWLCVLAFLGLNLGAKAAMVRLLAHMQRREEQQAEEARTRTTAALQAMRYEANLGQAHLTLAKQQIGSRHRHQHSSSGGSEGPWAPAAGLVRGASGGSSASSNAAAGGLPGGVLLEGAFGQLGPDAGADAAATGAAAPRPVATGATAVPGGRVAAGGEGAAAATAGGQEPVAPGTPSASEEAAAAYSAAAKGRRSGSGSLRWAAAAEDALGDFTEQQSADSSSSGSNSIMGAGHWVDSRGLAGNQGVGSEQHSGQAAAGAADAQALQQRQQLLQELLSAANTSAADASPSLAAAAALAVDAEHPWHGPDGGLPLAAHAQTAFSDNAFKCFVRAVHTLQRLNLQDDCMPLAICRADKGDPLVAPSSATAAAVDSTAAAAAMAAGHAAGPGITAAASAARFKAAAVAAGVSGAVPHGLAAAMSLEAVGSSPRATTPAGMDGVDASGLPFAAGAADAGAGRQPEQQHFCVLEDEQANLYCCWAESVLLKHNACACAGCTALAVHAVRIAHIAVVRLFNRVHKQRMRLPLRWRAVGQVLSRIVYVHIVLMCRTEAAASPSKASVWRAQQCLSEWDQLVAAGLAGGPDQQEAAAALTVGNTVEGVVELLRLWTKTAESDLLIAEALLGSRLSSLTTLDEALTAALVTPVPPIRSCLLGSPASAAMPGGSSTSCLPVLVRPVSAALLSELQSARGLAPCPSPAVKHLAAQVADATAAELSAGARLRELLAGRVSPSTQEGVAALAAAITAAESFSSLAADVEAARELHEQSCTRAEVAAQLQTVVDKVLRLTSRVSVASGSSTGSSGGGAAAAADRASSAGGSAGSRDDVMGLSLQGFSLADWQQYVAMLEAAVGAAKDANVSVTKARKLIKELQAQVAAAKAAAGLDACMSRRPCGSSALRQAISKAEAAASAVSGTATTSATGGAGAGSGSGGGVAAGAGAAAASSGGAASSSCVFSELLVVRLQAAKKRLDIERAAEALHKASVTYKSVAELPKLETAVLNARKVGAEELAPDEYKAASELRARLTGALRVKQQLESALKGLASTSLGTGPRGRQLEQLAEPVEAAIREAARCEELLPGEAARASELLEAWRTSSACEAKLSRALRDGCSAATLSRIISEAAAAGVKVTSAKRILKLQQLLDAAVMAAGESAASVAGVASSGRGQLVAKLEAAEAGGVAPSVLHPARQLLRKLLAVDARHALEAALKPHSDWCANTRISTLRAALDKAEEALGCSVQELEEQQQQHEGQQGGDVPQQQDQQQKGMSDAASAADGAEQCKQQQAQQHSRPATSAACSVSTAASSAGSKGALLQQQLMRADSVASSEACSDASSLAPSSTTGGGGGSTAGVVQHGSRRGSVGVGGGIEPEVLAALQELSLRAWQLLQQDQQQLEERERERLEQERERRERERKERQRAEAERAERGKAEREKAAQERKAARAKAAAERAKAFTVVFGTSAGSSYSSSGNSSSTAAAGPSARAGGKQWDTARHSVDSSSGGAGAGQGDADRLQAVVPAEADAASGPSPGSVPGGSGQSGKRWGPSRQQQEARGSSSASPAVASKSGGHKGTAVRSSSPAAAVPAGRGADSSSSPPVVALAHARCDSFEILGDEHSKLGLDMLALLESPEDSSSAPNSTTAATQQQQQQLLLLRASASVDVPATQPPQGGSGSGSSTGVDGQQQQQQQQVGEAAAGGSGGSQLGTSHPATPKFNLVDLGGASWGVDAEGLASSGRPGSAGSGIRCMSPGAAAAAARVTAAMDSARQSLDLQVGGAAGGGSGGQLPGASMWRSPLGLGVEGPAAAAGGGGSGLLPPLAPVSRGQQLPSARQPGVSASQGGRALTDDEQQHLAGLTSSRGANSFDPVSSPAGKISPVGTAVTTLGGSGHVPEPAFLHRYGVGGTASGSGSDAGSGSGSMGLSSPRSYPQLQQAHPSLVPYAAHSQGVVGGAPLLSSFPDGSATQTAAAINSMAGSGEPFWLLQQAAALDQQQQQQLAGRSTSGLLSSSGMLQLGGGASVFSSMPQPALAGPDVLQLQYEQQLLQLQQQQLQQVGFAAGADHLPGAGLLSTALSSAPHAPPVNAVGGAPQGPLGGVGALSGSFAFGAPYSSSFSPAPMRGSSSLGCVPAGDAGDGPAGQEGGGGGGGSGSVSRPELLLPDDLNFSPPSSGLARWLE